MTAPVQGRVVRYHQEDFVAELSSFVVVAATDTESIRYVAELPKPVFEDAMRTAAGRACGNRHVVTKSG